MHPRNRWILGAVGIWLSLTIGLIIHSGLINLLVTTLFFGSAIAWKRSHQGSPLKVTSQWLDRGLAGLLLIAIVAMRWSLPPTNLWVRFLPFLSAMGLGLLLLGRQSLRSLWHELLLFLVLAVPLEQLVQPLNQSLSLTVAMAQFSNFVLWYVGFDTSRQGETIFLDQHSVWVGPNCTGIVTILWMVQLAILVLFLYPTRWYQKWLLPLGAIAIVLLFNGLFRVPLLVLLAAYNQAAFEVFHSDRMAILSTVPILLFAGFCYKVLRPNDSL